MSAIAEATATRPDHRWDFAGRVAIVTGGSRGIGRAVVTSLARAGSAVVFSYRSSTREAQAVLSEAAALDAAHPALAVEGDLTLPDTIERIMRAAAARFGRVDFLINNAGIVDDAALFHMTDAQWDAVVDVNLGAAVRLTRRVLGELIHSPQGRIVNIASVAGVVGVAGQTNYCAAKAGLIGFTRALAKEIGRFGTTVNAVAPGYVRTAMLDAPDAAAAAEAAQAGRVPLRRLAIPQEVADVTLFLLSQAAAYITGQVIVVDGGLT